MEKSFLGEALRYADMGLSVIPIIPGQKRPLVKWQQYQTQRATKEQIIEWWTNTPSANIGIVTGDVSDVFVVDIDTEEGQQNLLQYGFEIVDCPTVITPRNGQHLYFKNPSQKITIGAGIISGTDFRGNGGFVVAPPSVNGSGKRYVWQKPFDRDALADLPILYINKLISSIKGGVGGCHTSVIDLGQSVTLFTLGTRDNDLFHTANCLVKGGMKEREISQVLERLILSWGENPDKKWIESKIKSSLDRAERKERNLAREVEEYIAVTSGDFTVTSCYQNLNIVTSCDKAAARKAVSRLKDSNIIEKVGNKDGVYRKVEIDFDYIKFDENEQPEVEYPVKLPIGINDMAEISQGNIILVAGEFNAGKTTFLLNVLKDNKNELPIRYISSEMSKSEFKKRFATFALPLSFWMQDEKTEYIKKSYDFHNCIKPDALNIIDYMEFRDSDYTKGAEYLTQIHDKLNTGIAIVAIQKKEGQRMPRSGDMILEKPRLAISFSKNETNCEYPQGICEVLKCKIPKLGKIDGKKLRFELQRQGSLFHVLKDWGYWRP